jgi:hypothetical protein
MVKPLKGDWHRRGPSLLLTAIRRQLGLGVPTPGASATVPALAASGRCTVVPIDHLPRQLLPEHDVTGDFAALEEVRGRIDNPVARATFDRMLRGGVTQPEERSFVANLAGGRVTNDAGIVMAAGEAVLEDVSGIGFADDSPANPLRLSHLPRPRPTPQTLAVLTTGPHYKYYHWLLEALPRLDLYERSAMAIDGFYAPIRHRFQRESLALLGVPQNRIVPATRHAHLAPARLLVSSLHGSLSRAKTDFLFRRLTAHLKPWGGPAHRIYISRGSRGPRSIVNERELLRALQPLGFRRHRLEGMPLAAQIALFHRAECVIGPHGAGLANLVFCRPGTKVVEIGTPYRPWTCFYEIAHHRQLDYHLHLAGPVRVRHFDPGTAVGDSDMRVDPAAVRAVAELILADRTRRPERAAA